MKKLLSLILVGVSGLLLAEPGHAQVSGFLGSVTRYNQSISGGGSARIRAMGGAQTALGGDVSSAYLNPAGLGFYNRSAFSITPTFISRGNDATYLGNTNYQFKNNLNISNLGIAFRGSSPKNSSNGWQGGTFAISYQQLSNFSNSFSYQGSSPNASYVDSFLFLDDTQIDELLDSGDLHTTLAYESGLISDNFSDVENGQEYFFYDTYFPLATEEYPVLERETVNTSGSQGQWNFSYGGNFNDKIYIGGGIGIHSITYRRSSTFTDEADPNFYSQEPAEVTERFPNNRFEMVEDLLQEGGGINATLGIIARPVEYFTVGLSYRTPTFYTIEDTYTLDYRTYFRDDNSVEEALSDILTLNYNLRTPGVFNAGAAYFFGKKGIITADMEYIDHSNSRLTDNDNFLTEDNQDIPTIFGAAINYRLGGEYRHENLRFRLGYAHQASPYRGTYEGNYDTNTFSGGHSFSGGAGIRFSSFYTDLALVHQQRDLVYYPMERPEVNIQNRQTRLLLTLGLNF